MKATEISSLYYYGVVLLIGLPTWYWTTTPLHRSLPDVSGLMVHSQRVRNQVKLMVVICDDNPANDGDSSSSFDKISLRQHLQQQFGSFVNPTGEAVYTLDWRVRAALEAESGVIHKARDHDLQWLDDQLDELESHQARGDVWMYVLDASLFDQLVPKRLKSRTEIVYGSNRFVFVRSLQHFHRNADSIVFDLQQQLFQPNSLEQKENVPSKSIGESNALLSRKVKMNLNLIVENASDSSAFFDSARYLQMQKIIELALRKNSGIYSLLDVEVFSQFVHYALTVDYAQKHIRTRVDPVNGPQRVIHLNEVHTLLSQIESRLTPPICKHVLNLNIIIPNSNEAPLHFLESTTNRSSNSVATQSHGQLLIWNEEHDFNLAFKVFVRTFLGLPARQIDNSLRLDIFFSKLELDRITRRIALAQLSATLSALESIVRLIQKGSNIVIEQQVAERMQLAVDYAHSAIDHLENDSLDIGYGLSSRAFIHSESAFYDPSLLSLLYFPEDQKYAIYFPLFLPVALQLVVDLKQFRRKWSTPKLSKIEKLD